MNVSTESNESNEADNEILIAVERSDGNSERGEIIDANHIPTNHVDQNSPLSTLSVSPTPSYGVTTPESSPEAPITGYVDGVDEILACIEGIHCDYKRFKTCRDQIILLNNRIESYKTRYHRAIEANRHSFLYSIRIQLQVLEITRNLFYDSAKNISMIIEGHQQKFLELTGRFLTNVEIETGLLSTD